MTMSWRWASRECPTRHPDGSWTCARLDRLVEAEVLSKLRHRDLNTEAAELSGLVPTSENLATGILRMLEASWRRTFPDGRPALDRVRIHETRRNLFEISKLP